MANREKHSPERYKEKAPPKSSLEERLQEIKIRLDSRLQRKNLQRGIAPKRPPEKLKSITYREGEVHLEKKKSELGRLQRALRFENLTKAVEQRYNIPDGLLLGMMMHESYADPFQPNEIGDGGLGLIHMQPAKASEYGLKILDDSKALRDRQLGEKLRSLIKKHPGDLQKLMKFDDRFDPLKNIDAAGRMIRDRFQKTKDWDEALGHYSGRPYREYGRFVRRFQQMAEHDRQKAAQDFAMRNPGQKFQEYLKRCYKQNEQFGLEAYKKETASLRRGKRAPLARQP